MVIEKGSESLEEAMDRLQPVFVASWGSTVLVEALNRGVIPITVAPLCCLRWPVDQDKVRTAIESSDHYDRIVEHLRSSELSP